MSPSSVEIGQEGLKKKWKCKKVRRDGQTNGQADSGQSEKKKAHLSFQFRWADILRQLFFL